MHVTGKTTFHMKKALSISSIILIAFLTLSCNKTQEQTDKSYQKATVSYPDPLPSWNNNSLKKDIISYVEKVTKEGSPDFIPVTDRIATFDNDGTLWAEQPVIQGLFAFTRAKSMAEKNPALKNKQPFKAILTGDKEYLHKMDEKGFLELVIATHTGMSEEEFNKEASVFFEKAKHPTLGVPISKLVYQPQLELLSYLKANDFTTYICSGGTQEFMRPISEKYYGIPAEHVIGSQFKYAYVDSAGINDIVRKPGLVNINDKQTKPVNIQYAIGKRPVFAAGNERSGGDVYMLRFCQGNKYANFQLLINHDDKIREFEYAEKDNRSLGDAQKYGWHVVSMKNDWKTIFP